MIKLYNDIKNDLIDNDLYIELIMGCISIVLIVVMKGFLI